MESSEPWDGMRWDGGATFPAGFMVLWHGEGPIPPQATPEMAPHIPLLRAPSIHHNIKRMQSSTLRKCHYNNLWLRTFPLESLHTI